MINLHAQFRDGNLRHFLYYYSYLIYKLALRLCVKMSLKHVFQLQASDLSQRLLHIHIADISSGDEQKPLFSLLAAGHTSFLALN